MAKLRFHFLSYHWLGHCLENWDLIQGSCYWLRILKNRSSTHEGERNTWSSHCIIFMAHSWVFFAVEKYILIMLFTSLKDFKFILHFFWVSFCRDSEVLVLSSSHQPASQRKNLLIFPMKMVWCSVSGRDTDTEPVMCKEKSLFLLIAKNLASVRAQSARDSRFAKVVITSHQFTRPCCLERRGAHCGLIITSTSNNGKIDTTALNLWQEYFQHWKILNQHLKSYLLCWYKISQVLPMTEGKRWSHCVVYWVILILWWY